ncbi:MAG: DNA-3-methyladenine glycosylase [Candidatus Eisenbacteria bacterium]
MRPLPRAFYARPAPIVARALLGRVLVHDSREGRQAGRIVEVEAYRGERDPASHAFRGITPRTRGMFGPPGHAYVYFTYGMHHCVNLVCEAQGSAAAVLIRALEPIEGLEAMRARRAVQQDARLARGPGCVAQALGLDRSHDGLDLTLGPLFVADLPRARGGHRLAVGPRIGIRVGLDRHWRFWLAGHPCVSVPRGVPRVPR